MEPRRCFGLERSNAILVSRIGRTCAEIIMVSDGLVIWGSWASSKVCGGFSVWVEFHVLELV